MGLLENLVALSFSKSDPFTDIVTYLYSLGPIGKITRMILHLPRWLTIYI